MRDGSILFSEEKKKRTTKIPFNYESGHIQFFTLNSFKEILRLSNLKIDHIVNGTLMGADLSGSTILKFNFMKNINTKIVDFLPSFMSATWIFKLSKDD